MTRREQREAKIEDCLVAAEAALRAANTTFARAVSTTTISAKAAQSLISLQNIAAELRIKATGRNER